MADNDVPQQPVLVIMGVSGSGKSTVAGILAGQLGWDLAEGDDLHPPANGHALYARVFLHATSQIACQSANLQVYCTITINWTENIANATAQEKGSTALQNQSYQLVVSP